MGADRPSVQAQGFTKVGLPVRGHRHETPPPPPSLPAGSELLIQRPRKARPKGDGGAAAGITASAHCRASWSSGPRGGRSSSAPAPPPPLCRPRAPPTPARPRPCAGFPLARPLSTHTHRTRRHVPPDPGAEVGETPPPRGHAPSDRESPSQGDVRVGQVST